MCCENIFEFEKKVEPVLSLIDKLFLHFEGVNKEKSLTLRAGGVSGLDRLHLFSSMPSQMLQFHILITHSQYNKL